jgi:hypothetical protein
LETACRAIWKSLNAPPQTREQGWGDFRKDIDDYLEGKNRNATFPANWKGARESFYREVHAQLSAVYRAWRNPTMHMEKPTH